MRDSEDMMTKQTRPEQDYPPVPPEMAAAAVTTIAHIYREQGWSLQAIADKVAEWAAKPSPHHANGLFSTDECNPILDDNMVWRLVKRGTIPM
jgi:hypothetical protein